MIYCGVFISKHFLEITALSGQYIFLGSENFKLDECKNINQWVDSFKVLKNEKCIYIFNEGNVDSSAMKFIRFSDEIYFVSHRKILGLILFIYEYCLRNNSSLLKDFNQASILASWFRFFDLDEIEHCM